MGGGGSFYDRDTTSRNQRTSSGTTTSSEEALGRNTRVHPTMLTKDRRIRTSARNPVCIIADVTGSMGNLPKIFWDKAPMIVGQTKERGYLPDPAFCVAAVGDVVHDRGPIQVAEFCQPREMDTWLERMWLEGNGGGNDRESYETMAWYFAHCCDLPEECTPFLIILGDEGFYDEISGTNLNALFGSEKKNVESNRVFRDLKARFHGNVFHIHRRYNREAEERIVRQWQSALGKNNVLFLGTDRAVADVTLGIFALMTGSRTIDEYIADMRQRGQDEERCAEVRETLQPLLAIAPPKRVEELPVPPPPPASSKQRGRKKKEDPPPSGGTPDSGGDDWKLV